MFWKKKPKIEVIDLEKAFEVIAPKEGDKVIVSLPNADENIIKQFKKEWIKAEKEKRTLMVTNIDVKVVLIKKETEGGK